MAKKKVNQDIDRLVTLCQEAFEANPMAALARKLYGEGVRWGSFVELCNKSNEMKNISEVCRCRLSNYFIDLEKGIPLPKGNELLR